MTIVAPFIRKPPRQPMPQPSKYGNLTFTLERIINAITCKKCLICEVPLDKNLGRKDWHIPLCAFHRRKRIEEITR